MNEDSEDTFEISDKDFDKVMKDFELKNKRGYDLLVKGGKLRSSKTEYLSYARE